MIKKDSYGAWIIWSIAAAFFFLEYIVRISPGVMAFQLQRDFNITAASLGMLSAFFYYPYVFMQIPVGILVDKYGTRWILGIMAIVCSASVFLFSSTNYLVLAELSRFLMGLTGAFAFVGALKLASTWFSPRRFGFLAGTTQALGMLGGAAGAGPLALLVTQVGWRFSLIILGVLIAVLSLIFLLIIRDEPEAKKTHNMITKQISFFSGLLIVLKNPMTWINGLIVGLLYTPTAAFGELWGPLYLQQVYGISAAQSASLISCIFVGWAIGGPIFGWVSDKIQRRRPVILGSAMLSLIFISILLYMPFLPISLLFLAAFLYGLSNIGVSTCYAAACEFNPSHVAGTSVGFTNMFSIMIGGALLQPVIGWLLDLGWHGEYLNGVRVYSTHNFQTVMLILPGCLILCIGLCIFLKESYGMDKTNAI
jgi:sugar phosphate permease